jgi:hypothetical protein
MLFFSIYPRSKQLCQRVGLSAAVPLFGRRHNLPVLPIDSLLEGYWREIGGVLCLAFDRDDFSLL